MSGAAPNQDRAAIFYGLGAVALWSTVATAFKVALSQMSPLELIWLASLVSWLLMGALVIRQGLLMEALRHGWRTAAWAGLMNPVAYYLVLFGAYDRLPGQEAMALNYTWALAMAFLAVPLLGQRLTRVDVLAGLIAYAGVWVIATRGEVFNVTFADPLGVGLALASTLLWALYWPLNVRDRRPPLVAQWQNFAVGLPLLTLLMLLGPGFAWSGWAAVGAGAPGHMGPVARVHHLRRVLLHVEAVGGGEAQQDGRALLDHAAGAQRNVHPRIDDRVVGDRWVLPQDTVDGVGQDGG